MEKRGVLGSAPLPDAATKNQPAPEAKPPVEEKPANELPANK